MAGLVGRQQQVRADEDLAAAGGVQLHVVFGLRQRIVRNGGEPVGAAIGAGEHAEHARHRLGARRIDAENARMRMRRAHHHRIGLALEAEIVAEAAASGGEPLVFLAGDRLADRAEVGGGVVCSRSVIDGKTRAFLPLHGRGRRMMYPAAREAPSFPLQMHIRGLHLTRFFGEPVPAPDQVRDWPAEKRHGCNACDHRGARCRTRTFASSSMCSAIDFRQVDALPAKRHDAVVEMRHQQAINGYENLHRDHRLLALC